MKILAGIVGGLVLAILASLLVTTALAASGRGSMPGVITFFLAWAIALVVAVRAPTTGKAWRYLLLSMAVLAFLLPLAGMLFTGHYLSTMPPSSEHSAAATAGAAIGGGLLTGLMGFIGFFLGAVFLVIGLLVGRDKQVVYIERIATVGMEPRS